MLNVPRLSRLASRLLLGGVLAVLAMLPLRAQGQGALSLDPELAISQYMHETWTVEDGVPQNSVLALEQTEDGFLWVGTQDGLARFDGVNFTVYQSLPSNFVWDLLDDGAGGLWIGTYGGGLVHFKDETFTAYTAEDGLAGDMVRALHRTSDGHLWIGTEGGGLSRYDGTSFRTYTTADGLASDIVLALDEDSTGALWIGTADGVSRWTDGAFERFTTAQGLPDDVTLDLMVDGEGTVWAATFGGVAAFRGGRFVATTGDACASERVNTLFEDARGTRWVGTHGQGVCRYVDGRLRGQLTTEQGLGHNWIRAIYEDREGNLWIGTDGGGLSRLRQGMFVPYGVPEGLADEIAYAVMEDRDGVVWVGTEEGLSWMEEGRITNRTPSDGLPGQVVHALHEGRSGDLWVGFLNAGLCRYEGRRAFRCLTTEDGLVSNNIHSLYEDDDGVLWVGTDVGLNRVIAGQVAAPTVEPAFADELINNITQGADGALWLATYGRGVARVHDGDLQFFGDEDGLKVFALYEDPSGALWAGTQDEGLCRLQDEQIACVSAEDGLVNGNTVLQVLDDGRGAFWLGSLNGITRASKGEVEAVLAGEAAQLSSIAYGKANGMRSVDATGGVQPAAWRAADGHLWFATSEGVVTTDPARLRVPDPPPVHIERLLVDGDAVPLQQAITVRPGRRRLDFYYTAPSFSIPEQVQFAYRLEGYDDEWIQAGTARDAHYTNLGPGDYRFEVRARNADGVWGQHSATLSFFVQPFFYQTPWFILLVVLALGLVSAGGYRLRVRHLKARERELTRTVEARTRELKVEKERTEAALRDTEEARREAERQKERAQTARAVIEKQADQLRELDRLKTRFFNNVSHEFRTPLTLMIGPLENLLAGAHGQLGETVQSQLGLMLRNARQLLRLINQLLDLSKLESNRFVLHTHRQNVVPLLEGIVLPFRGAAEARGITLDFEAPEEPIPFWYDAQALEKVFYNLLSNALKFTPEGGRIDVQVAPGAEGGATIRVADTGTGIPEADLPHIFDRFHQVDGTMSSVQEGTGIGLALTKELVTLHGGTITVVSTVGEGTTFTVELPEGTATGTDEAGMSEPITHGSMVELAAMEPEYVPEDAAEEAGEDARPTILVVDDSRDIRTYMRACLEPAYRVVEANDGADGLEKVRREHPALVVSDVMMPHMDGYELCQKIKSDDELNHIPVILLTAKASIEMKVEGLRIGADDYIAKPFNARELLARIKSLLTLRRQARELKELNVDLETKVQEQLEVILEQRKAYEQELVEAKEHAEASSRLKSTILDNMSHEIRTPISAILGFAQILSQEVVSEHQEFIDYIEENGKRLLTTLNSILDLSKIESAGFQVSRDVFDLGESVFMAVSLLAPIARKKAITLRVERPDDPMDVRLDRGAVDRVLNNLIGNAIKFTDEGEVVVSVGCDDAGPFLQVRDTGVGISAEFLPRLFEAFQQESAGLARTHQGSGLGLAITNRLVELLEGRIEVESEKGVGTVFTVHLPMEALVTEEEGVEAMEVVDAEVLPSEHKPA